MACTLEGRALVGKGLTADVYGWGEGRVLKLFHSWRRREKIQMEFEVSRAVHAGGFAAPAVFEMVEVEGRMGIVFERVDGVSMLQLVERRPWMLFSAARVMGELHAALHGRRAPEGLPTQRERMEGWIDDAADLPEADRRAAVCSLAELPDGAALGHGDFHPANILFAGKEKRAVVIDWSGATRGHPMGDVARTVHLFKHADLPTDAPAHLKVMLKLGRTLLLRSYLRRYFQLRGGSEREIEAWMAIQKAAASAWRCARHV